MGQQTFRDCQAPAGFDTPPRLLSGTKPLYPISEVLKGNSGVVEFDVRIETDGSARIVKREHADSFFESHSAIALRDWKFEPASAGGVAVPVVCHLRFIYSTQRASQKRQG
jgi:hypothetical protein